MKLVFVSVLIINILFFVYHFFFNNHSDVEINLPITDKSQIILIKELDEDHLKKLQALSNNNDANANDENNHVSVEPNNVEKVNEVADICYTLGPFSKKIITHLRSELEVIYNKKLSFEIQTTSESTYYRIYIPPLENIEEIENALLKLSKNSLNDHYVMAVDGRKNAIALGVYKEKLTAEKIANKAKAIGFSTTIEAISKDKKSLYTLNVYFKASDNMGAYNRLIKQKKLKSIICLNKT